MTAASSRGGERPQAPAQPSMWRVLRFRDFRLLWTGMSVSLVGDGVFLVALAWQVYALSNVPTALSVVGLAMTLPHVVLLLWGGAVSDRFDRRNVMVVADAVRCAAIGTIGVLSLAGGLGLPMLVILSAVHGGATAFFGPAFDAITPELVPDESLVHANSLDQFVRPVALRLAGPALGGLLIGVWGLGAAFVFDGLTYLASIAALLAMTRRASPTADRDTSTMADIRDGFRYVRAHVWLWGTLAAAAVAYLLFMGPVEVLLPYLVRNQPGGSATVLGVVFAMGGIGAVGGAMIVARLGFPRRYITCMYLCWGAATLAVTGYGLATEPWQLMAAGFAFNSLETAGTVVWATTKQRLVPGRLLGRVSSLDWFVSIGLLPVSFAITAPVAAILGAKDTLVMAGLLGAGVTFAALLVPGMLATEQRHPLGSAVTALDPNPESSHAHPVAAARAP
jgi:MFS family permease